MTVYSFRYSTFYLYISYTWLCVRVNLLVYLSLSLSLSLSLYIYIYFLHLLLYVLIYLTRYFHSRFVFTRMRNKVKTEKSVYDHLFKRAPSGRADVMLRSACVNRHNLKLKYAICECIFLLLAVITSAECRNELSMRLYGIAWHRRDGTRNSLSLSLSLSLDDTFLSHFRYDGHSVDLHSDALWSTPVAPRYTLWQTCVTSNVLSNR